MYQSLSTNTISVTNFTQQSTSETCTYLAGQEILHLLWYPNVHDCSQKQFSIPSYQESLPSPHTVFCNDIHLAMAWSHKRSSSLLKLRCHKSNLKLLKLKVFWTNSDCQFVWDVDKCKEMALKTFSPHMYTTDTSLDMFHHMYIHCVDTETGGYFNDLQCWKCYKSKGHYHIQECNRYLHKLIRKWWN
jgi:hypothetical protein